MKNKWVVLNTNNKNVVCHLTEIIVEKNKFNATIDNIYFKNKKLKVNKIDLYSIFTIRQLLSNTKDEAIKKYKSLITKYYNKKINNLKNRLKVEINSFIDK